VARREFEIKLSNERLNTPSGLAIVGFILDSSDFDFHCDKKRNHKRSPPHMPDSDIMRTYLGLLCQGTTDFEAVKQMQEGDDEFFRYAIGIKTAIPSAERLRQRMDEMGTAMREKLLNSNVSLFKNLKISPTPLPNGHITLDIDVSPFDNSKTKKEGVSRTYKGFYGYSPIFAYLGKEGYCVNTKLRHGKQHCQKETPDFLKETLRICQKITDKPLLVRLDSGNDAAENIGILTENNVSFIIKRNLRNESTLAWLDEIKKSCLPENVLIKQEGNKKYIGSISRDVKYFDSNGIECVKSVRIVYEATERAPSRQLSLLPDFELNTYWTNTDFSPAVIIDLYHKHGECEQFHSEFKSDMDVERLPSGKFDTNCLVLELAMIAYNILRIMAQNSLNSGVSPKTKREVFRRRIRTVISNLIQFASHVTVHARKTIFAVGRCNIWRFAFVDLFERFKLMRKKFISI